ncbi:acyl-CoA synthetase [Caldalkalibacillus thermarum]|uniref:fatty acyl-AMP ligase n=1 Tax=Caldalkalibacillus thermarum TaxID=296745 RepID=UPI0016680B37|nr:fatty acyl-AMP ligase [Caldalkalibacillus thermarum]GGK32583.1 acyl-CoA synthetase [Caldalkalibacillus thermarum]
MQNRMTLHAWTSISDILRYRSEATPSQTAFTFFIDAKQEVHVSYAELDHKARVIAGLLQMLDASGKRVLLVYPPGPEYIFAFFGCLYAGASAVPIYPPRANSSLNRLNTIVNDAEPSLVLTNRNICSLIEKMVSRYHELTRLKWIASDEADDTFAYSWLGRKHKAEDVAFIQYTSGSTTTPRGVLLSHANLLNNIQRITQFFGLSEKDRGVIWLPPYHDMGLIGGVLTPICVGFPVHLMAPVDFLKRPYLWLKIISEKQATCSGGPNFAYEMCLDKITQEQKKQLDLSSWTLAFNGAEPVKWHTIERFSEAFASCGFQKQAFYPCYGLAESTLMVSGIDRQQGPVACTVSKKMLNQHKVENVAPDHPDACIIVSSGLSSSDQEILIVNPETLAPCKEDEIGEIWIKSPSVAQGYWNNQSLSSQTFEAYESAQGRGPYLRTGDLGFMQDGHLYVTGRMKHVLIIRGRNYYAHDIEYTVQHSHEAFRVGAGAAFAVEMEGEERLVIVQEVDRMFRKKIIPIELITGIRQAIADEHGLEVYAVVLLKPGSIPKTSSGKIQHHICRDQFLNGMLKAIDGGQWINI